MRFHDFSVAARSICLLLVALAGANCAAQTGSRLLQPPLSESIEPAPPQLPLAPSPANANTAGTTQRALILGTGFAIAPGYILTAHHVVQNRSSLMVGPMPHGHWVRAEVLKSDAGLDLALLSANVSGPGLALASNLIAPTGLEISVIGYPQPAVQGLSAKITQGIINGTRTSRVHGQTQTLLQISSEITSGNSGSPVLAPDGTVIGLVQRKINAQKVAEKGNDLIINVAYALPTSQILQFLKDASALITTRSIDMGKLLRPYQLFEENHSAIYSIISRQPGSMPAGGTAAQETTGLKGGSDRIGP